MVPKIICLLGLVFAAIALIKWLRQSDQRTWIPPVNNVEQNPPKDVTVLAADRAEYYDLLEKHSADPMNIPAPIPPSKPHPYWGNEADVFGYKNPERESE